MVILEIIIFLNYLNEKNKLQKILIYIFLIYLKVRPILVIPILVRTVALVPRFFKANLAVHVLLDLKETIARMVIELKTYF